jgi:hypothetical protein
MIRPTVREIANLRKADKSILFQIVLDLKPLNAITFGQRESDGIN